MFRGVILSGGHGSRLYPATKAVSKQLLTVYDKPLIYYPLCTLIELGVRDILIVLNADDRDLFFRLLGNGNQLGLNIQYAIQTRARGIADALLISRAFVGDSNVALILGDNIFCRNAKLKKAAGDFESGGAVFAYPVANPSEFGVAELDACGRTVSISEKPDDPDSNLAVTGLYLYDSTAFDIASNLTPSDRGELEITDVNRAYLSQSRLDCTVLEPEEFWFDCGSPDGLLSASKKAREMIREQNLLLGYIERAALEQSMIDEQEFRNLLDNIPLSTYKENLLNL
ncbi:MAG: sugar phosphate nucleotidyltransferase [bacterium]|nr:sugar phosphate nucleotidyltransferase [bacterium]